MKHNFALGGETPPLGSSEEVGVVTRKACGRDIKGQIPSLATHDTEIRLI